MNRIIDTDREVVQKLPERVMQRKTAVAVLALSLMFALLGGRLAYLQIYRGDYWARISDGNRIRIVPLRAPRGDIFDRNGNILATSRPAYSVSVMVMNREVGLSTALKLADMLGLDPDEVAAKIERYSGRLYEPVRIASDISPEVHTLIEESRSDLPGAVIDIEPIREYRYGSVAAHIIGYVGEIRDTQLEAPEYADCRLGDIIGQAGIETRYDSLLRGIDGGRQVEVDYRGRPTQKEMGRIDPQSGDNMFLSLDIGLQQALEEALSEQFETLQTTGGFPNAKSGAAVVIAVNSGEVLAMASLPSYDLNEFARGISGRRLAELQNDPLEVFNNRAISGTYAPGSTFKLVTALAALEEGRVSADEWVYDPGYHPVVPSLACHVRSGHGLVNLDTAIRVSCNVYFYEMGKRLGIDLIAKWGDRLGLGKKTGIDLAGEAGGLMPTTKWKREAYENKNPAWIREPQFLMAEDMMSGMGQVYHSYTPLQMANYVATLANGGTRYEPHLLIKTVSSSDGVEASIPPEPLERLGATQTSVELLNQAMGGVTKPGGTAGYAFYGFPIETAGKTGTAENPHGDDHAWYVGFAPLENPEIAFAILIEQGGHGSTGAAPLARRILEYYFRINDENPEW